MRVMTLHVLSAGDGYTYYTNEVATGDIKREQGRELGDYYTADGNPPGVWMGGGIDLLGVRGTVSEDQMRALFGEGLHPNADAMIAAAQEAGATVEQAQEAAKLGRSFYAYNMGGPTLAGRITEGYDAFARMNHREPDANERRLIRVREGAQAFREAKGRQPADKEELGRFITAATRPTQQAVAGFDMVFSPPKSVSTLWALGDERTRKAVEAAHEKAIADTIAYMEREAVATRAGRNGVAQIEVEGGLIATRFRHYDSRNGDPQLHDHVVVANKVKGSDGKWRTLDSKLLHRMNVPSSEVYNQAVIAETCRALGVAAEEREVTPGKRPVLEIAGVDHRLTEGFSSRSVDIKARVAELEQEYREKHGRGPNEAARIKLAQQATLDTRPAKEQHRSLEALSAGWRHQATQLTDQATVDGLLASARQAARAQRAEIGERESFDAAEAAQLVVDTVSEHRAVWGTHHLEAEARRWVSAHAPRIDMPADAVEQITRRAVTDASLTITPPPAHKAFQPLIRTNGDSIYDDKGRTLHTSRTILTAEDMLLDAARDRTFSPVLRETFEKIAVEHGQRLDAGQRALAREFACSPSRLVVGSGPAGAGKTTALKVAARAVEAQGGRMVGLAPSAAAAAVMRDAIGIRAITIDKLLVGKGTLAELNQATTLPEGTGLRAGDVVVVDEAGMAGTVKLAKLTRLAELAGAHIRLIGDDRQLHAVEAGGALRLIEREVGAVHLESVHRFTNPDEAAASLLLRDPARTGDPFAWYLDQGRVQGGDREHMTQAVFTAWQTDTNAGRETIMLAGNNATVRELNARAQAYRIATGEVYGDDTTALRDGLTAHVGDRIVTRTNDATLPVNRGLDMVKNGDLWTVTSVNADGSLSVTHDGHGGSVTLPAAYVAASTELGYASTVHRAQGMTVDSAHVLADRMTSREAAYVALTRGREDNRIYLETGDAEPVAQVLAQIAAHSDPDQSAHDTIRDEHARVHNIVTLSDQYGDVAARANDVRFHDVAVRALGEEVAQTIVDADSWPALATALTHAEKAGYDPVATLRSAHAQREIDSAEDVPAVLHWRIETVLDARGPRPEGTAAAATTPAVPEWIADPRPLTGPGLPEEWQTHLQERYDHLAELFVQRGEAVAADKPAWSAQLGDIPVDEQRRAEWVRLAAEVDTFRARYQVPDTEDAAIPGPYRAGHVGRDLAARVTASHKSDELRQHAAQRRDTAEQQRTLDQAQATRERLNKAIEDRAREEQQRQHPTPHPDQPTGPTHTRGPRL